MGIFQVKQVTPQKKLLTDHVIMISQERPILASIYINTISEKTSVVFQASAKANHFLTRSFDSGFDGFDEDLKEEFELP